MKNSKNFHDLVQNILFLTLWNTSQCSLSAFLTNSFLKSLMQILPKKTKIWTSWGKSFLLFPSKWTSEKKKGLQSGSEGREMESLFSFPSDITLINRKIQ